jgi:hypothetical protein
MQDLDIKHVNLEHMAYFIDCPHCGAPMPRGNTTCDHCGLSFEESMRRSDLPLSERPPAALYVPTSPPTALRDDQKFWIGLSFCIACLTLALGRWGAGLVFLTLAVLVTPAARDKLSLPRGAYRLLLVCLFIGGCLSF